MSSYFLDAFSAFIQFAGPLYQTDLAVKSKIATQSPGVKTGLSSLATKIISE